MRGSIGLAVNDAARYTDFWAALEGLKRPDGWRVRFAQGSDRIIQRNRLVGDALSNSCDWIFFVDDDNVFHAELLNRLLSHNLPIVGGLYMQRVYPFSPIAYSHKIADKYMPIDLRTADELEPVVACGTGAMLISTEVFRNMEEPWFPYGVHSEDMIFCQKAIDLGYEIFVDTHEYARVGHITTTKVWPTKIDQEWMVGFTVSDRLNLTCPIGTDEVKPLM